MGFVLIVFFCICAMLGVLRLIRHLKERRIRVATHASKMAAASYPRGRLVWMEAARVLQLLASSHDIMVFRLVDEGEARHGLTVFRGEMAVTLCEFEDTVPWIPMGSRILVHRIGGIGPHRARCLATAAHGRDVLLMKGLIPAMIEKPLRMAAERRN